MISVSRITKLFTDIEKITSTSKVEQNYNTKVINKKCSIINFNFVVPQTILKVWDYDNTFFDVQEHFKWIELAVDLN